MIAGHTAFRLVSGTKSYMIDRSVPNDAVVAFLVTAATDRGNAYREFLSTRTLSGATIKSSFAGDNTPAPCDQRLLREQGEAE
jgi:hypothetical protein